MLALLAGFIVVMGGVSFEPTYTIYVNFNNPGGLQSGAPVIGINYGRVGFLASIERESPLPYEALTILAVLLLNATLGFVQESRAEQALASLRQLSAARAEVLRDGVRRSVTAALLVPGDILLIEEGGTVPADARVFEAVALQTVEAALTGR